jgi:protein-tyrosine phosphatase
MNNLPIFQSDAGLRLEGAPNFRDIGGVVNQRGQTLSTGLIFRSDHLGKLTHQDIQRIQSHNNKPWLVLDFRGLDERNAFPCTLPDAKVVSLPIEPTVLQALNDLNQQGLAISTEQTVELMQDTYRNFILKNSHTFASFFDALISHPECNVVFHCTAGKDRTGVAATLLLHALNVSMPSIWHDYLLTNERLKAFPIHDVSPAIAQVLRTVQPAFLQAALDAIKMQYVDLDAYLDHLGLNQQARQLLADRLLSE